MLATLLALGLLVPAAVAPAGEVVLSEKVAPELRAAVEASADPAATFRAYAVLADRLDARDLLERARELPRGARQAGVAEELRAFATPRQERLLDRLASLEADGLVTDVRPLWINNTVVFRGRAAALEAVAALPEVVAVRWDPVVEPGLFQDDLGTSDGGATTYYADGFESGALGPEWSVATTGCGDVSVTDAFDPPAGGFHLVIASTTDGCAGTATLTLAVDLTGATTVGLRYRLTDFGDEFLPGADIVEASDDGGANWTKVADLTGIDGATITETHDLDGLGLAYGPDFRVRWRWSDNFAPPTDGIGLDDVELADAFPPPPVPGPTANLVGLQAPDLWALGVRGQGVKLLNIDAGADVAHPDLAGRIWSNPLDPANGVDDDGNGYVDDVLGWDFVDDDADPDPGLETHGTNTSGILVGDGASGLLQTGMAPGAQLAIARIDTATEQWEALQWAMSVGMDCTSSSYSYKWWAVPKPDYHMHRVVHEVLLAAGIVHANSIGNDGGLTGIAPVPFNISAPGLVPGPWVHPVQFQTPAGRAAVLACGGIESDDAHYAPSGAGPSAWEDLLLYDPAYPFAQQSQYHDYPYGGFGGGFQGLMKPDVVAYTEVPTTTNGGGYDLSFGGTSASTPHLGGALALLLSAQPRAEPRHIAQALQITAEDLGAPGKDPVFGAGKIQVRDAALRLLGLVVSTKLSPGPGDTLTITTYGRAGSLFVTLWSVSVGSMPFLGGTLDLGPPVFMLQAGVLTGQGNRIGVQVPHDAGLVGLEVHFQTVQDDTAGPTGQLLYSVVETVTITE